MLFSNALINSYFSHNEFVSLYHVFIIEYDDMNDDMKEEIKNIKSSTVYRRSELIYKTMLSHCLKCRKTQKVKIWDLKRQIKKNQCFYQNVQYVIVKNWDLYKSKELVMYWVTCNCFHNILRLFDVLPNFLFTTSETMRYYYL